MNITFANRTVLVTGAAHGFGRAIALAFQANGARVLACDMNTEGLAETARLSGGTIGTFALDVGNRDAVHAAIAAAGPIDIAVNNAGGVRGQVGRPIEEISAPDWQTIFDVNVSGTFFVSQAVASTMKARKWGRIVNISSALGTGATPHRTAGSPGGSAAYASAKAAVNMLTKTLARELGPHGVTVNAVAPGTFLTPISASTRTPEEVADHLEHRRKTVVLARNGTLEELANSVLFLASDDASYVTGQILCVDGGRFDRL